jgi:hypothetical protein
MSRVPRIRRWLSVPAALAQNPLQPAAPSSANWGKGSPGADTRSAVGWLSFRRLADIPFDACLAALESWQRTGQDTELHVRQGLLRGPIEADRDSGTCRIQVRLARGPLRPPLHMRLDIDRWSSSQTALELIPCKRARPTAGYFRAGHHLLDSLTHSLQVWARSAPRTTSARPRPADVPQPQGAPGPLPPGPPQVAANAAAQAAPACPPGRTAALPHAGDTVGRSQRRAVRHDQAAPAPPEPAAAGTARPGAGPAVTAGGRRSPRSVPSAAALARISQPCRSAVTRAGNCSDLTTLRERRKPAGRILQAANGTSLRR